MLALGAGSVFCVVWLAKRMRISGGNEIAVGLSPKGIAYAFWLVREIIEANIEVTRLILDPRMPIRPRMVNVKAHPKTELGRVILANSITLTPGTVSVDMQDDCIWVHALSLEGAEEDLSGAMDRRVCELEA